MKKIIFSLGGFATTYSASISQSAQKKLSMLIYIMIASSAFSAMMITKTIVTFLAIEQHSILVWLCAFYLIFSLERLILTADIGKKGILIARGLMALVIACITSLSVELEFFGTSALNAQMKQSNIVIDSLINAHNKKVEILTDQRKVLIDKINNSINEISAKRIDVVNEVKNGNGKRKPGFGIVASDLNTFFIQDSALIERRIEGFRNEITLIAKEINSDSIQLQTKLNNMFRHDNNDPLEKLNLIHNLVFQKGSTIFIFLLIHLFFIGFEMIVLLGKISNKSVFEEYESARQAELKKLSTTTLLNDKLHEAEIFSQYERSQLNNEVAQMNAKGKAKLDAAKEQMAFIDNYTTIMNDIDELINEKINEEDRSEVKDIFLATAKENIKGSTKIFDVKSFILAFIFLITNILGAANPIVELNRSYATPFGELAYDRYYDQDLSEQTTIILIHGGAFQMDFGQKEKMTFIAQQLSSIGYQVFNINYLSVELNLDLAEGFWTSAICLDHFINHITSHQTINNVDEANVFFMGHSAGAITMLGYTSFDYEEIDESQYYLVSKYGYFKKANLQIRGVIALAGGWSSATHFNHDMPPFLFIHSRRDPIIPFENGLVFTSLGKKFNNLLTELKEEIDKPIEEITDKLALQDFEPVEQITEEIDKYALKSLDGSSNLHHHLQSVSASSILITLEANDHNLGKLFTPKTQPIIEAWIADHEIKFGKYFYIEKNKYILVSLLSGTIFLLLLKKLML
jgi:hypothetical protein